MEILIGVISLVVGTAALFTSLVAIAVGLTGGDVAKTLGIIEAQELPEVKRKTARCLMLLVAWGSMSFLATIPVVFWTIVHIDDNPVTPPWWFTIWMLLAFITGCYVLQMVGLLFRFAGILRDRDMLSMKDSLLFFWTLFGLAFQRARPND
ncbi:MAG: hypothetical protein U1A77_11075 [Pirellulales bacterium]